MDTTINLLSSTVMAALVAALVSLRTNERKINIENVTQERAKWRGAIRALADGLVKATREGDNQAIEYFCTQLSLNVNPFDNEDKGLIQAVKQLTTTENKDYQLSEVIDRISLLLKHDWERAKRESRPWFFRGETPRRITYSEFLGNNTQAQTKTCPQRKWISLLGNFAGLTLSAGIIFFLAAGLTEPFKSLVSIFNDSNITKPFSAWVQFLLWSAICGSIWSGAYLWFKGSEKKFLETWLAK
ncbi:hypothetical protein [Pseudogulbenkiania subflava]|nr:hypothetical protein [Pseudogulbenkiania subflava]